MALLEIRDLRTAFPGTDGVARVVDGVSLTVERGEIVGLLGESGCGKTLTALSVMGLVPAPGRVEAGSSIHLDGEELVGLPPARLREIRGRRVALVFQDPGGSLNPVLRVGDQVGEALRHHRGLSRSDTRRRVRELLADVGLETPDRVARAYPHQLSGGMRQRVALAGALACDPDLLLADEPTSALDVTVQARVLDLLARLRRERGLGILLVTHDVGVAARLCHRLVVLYAGQVVESGPAAQVLGSPAHPYTRALLAAAPGRRGDPLPVPIPGSVPGPRERPPGCRFADRCPRSWERCRREAPPLLVPAPGRSSRCWLVEEDR